MAKASVPGKTYLMVILLFLLNVHRLQDAALFYISLRGRNE